MFIPIHYSNPTVVWTSNFQEVVIGKTNVHSEFYGDRFSNRSRGRIRVDLLEQCFGKLIAQGVSEDSPSEVFFWTTDWVGVLTNNHGREKVMWLPRNPSSPKINLKTLPQRSEVFVVDFSSRYEKGDIIAFGSGEWAQERNFMSQEGFDPETLLSVYWTEHFVYAQEWEYEGEVLYLRAFPRHPTP